ncbi:MAG: 30S ribosomal protein S18 [Coriobacteriia bacterium]|nr:30S ribosomal protein S18 [Coriobacteriia bacterium]
MAEYVRQPRKRFCQFCRENTKFIDYKDATLLKKYMTDRGKIKPSRVTGTCTQHQRDLATAIKRSREMALVPYSVPAISNRLDRKSRN